MTRDEEAQLIYAIQSTNENSDLLLALWNACLPTVRKNIRSSFPNINSYDFEDLETECFIHFLYLIPKYAPNRDCRFNTFLCKCLYTNFSHFRCYLKGKTYYCYSQECLLRKVMTAYSLTGDEPIEYITCLYNQHASRPVTVKTVQTVLASITMSVSSLDFYANCPASNTPSPELITIQADIVRSINSCISKFEVSVQPFLRYLFCLTPSVQIEDVLYNQDNVPRKKSPMSRLFYTIAPKLAQELYSIGLLSHNTCSSLETFILQYHCNFRLYWKPYMNLLS